MFADFAQMSNIFKFKSFIKSDKDLLGSGGEF